MNMPPVGGTKLNSGIVGCEAEDAVKVSLTCKDGASEKLSAIAVH
jgi:hypothetical protein